MHQSVCENWLRFVQIELGQLKHKLGLWSVFKLTLKRPNIKQDFATFIKLDQLRKFQFLTLPIVYLWNWVVKVSFYLETYVQVHNNLDITPPDTMLSRIQHCFFLGSQMTFKKYLWDSADIRNSSIFIQIATENTGFT